MIEEALESLEHAIALSEARQEVPADNVTKRVAELYQRIQRTHSRCQRLSLSASELRSTCGSEASGVLQSISLDDDLTLSMLRESELKAGVNPLQVGRSARATTAISTAISTRVSTVLESPEGDGRPEGSTATSRMTSLPRDWASPG